MCNICNKSYLVRNNAVSTCLNENTAILYDPDTSREKIINHTGLFIWKNMDGSSDATEIAEALADEFEVKLTPAMQEDVLEFAREISAEGYAIVRETAMTTPLPREEYSDIKDSPRNFDLSLTGKCNLKCSYCYYANEMVGRNDISTEEWLKFFLELKSLGTHSVTLSGGEVFVHHDLFKLIDAIIAARLRFCILSNGTLITEKIITDLSKPSRRQRLDYIQISIDGASAEIHDKSRGKGSFNRAIKSLRMLKQMGFPVASRMTINRHNANDIENVAALLLDEIGLPSFGTNDAMPMGAGCNNQKSIVLSPQQQLQSMRILEKLEKKYNGRVTATAGPLSKIKSYREMEHARLTGEKTKRWIMGKLTACGGVFNKLSVNHDGIITPCNILPSTELGKINRDAIPKIWLNHPTLKALRDRRQIATRDTLGCQDCQWAEFCNGSCPGLACEMTGNYNLANPHDCYRNFLKTISEDDRQAMFIQPVLNKMESI